MGFNSGFKGLTLRVWFLNFDSRNYGVWRLKDNGNANSNFKLIFVNFFDNISFIQVILIIFKTRINIISFRSKKINLMQNLSSIYFVKRLHMFRVYLQPIIRVLPGNTTDSLLKRTISTNCWILTVYPLMMCCRYGRNM